MGLLNKKKILIDARCIQNVNTGIGVYCLRLLENLGQNSGHIGIIRLRNVKALEGKPFLRVHKTNISLSSHPFTQFFEQIYIPILCFLSGYKTFVQFDSRAPALKLGFRVISFVYDMSTLRNRGTHVWTYTLLHNLNLKMVKWFADEIITISGAAKSQINRYLAVETEKIHVVYPSDSKLELAESEPVPDLPGEFILCVGVTNQRKNLKVLLDAFDSVKKADSNNVSLVITGFEPLIADAIQSYSTPDLHNIGFVSNGVLRYLYEHAICLVFPSLDEGFGIPLLDACRFSLPVLCSDLKVFREVMGSGAAYFNPHSSSDLESALAKLLRGNRQSGSPVKEFSWSISSNNFLDIIGGK